MPQRFGLLIIGDEILSGKRADKHLPKVIELLAARGLALSWAEFVGDEPARITAALQRALASGDAVFSCGGIGATPDDHTRQCAAAALGVPLLPHAGAQALIDERMREVAQAKGEPYEPGHSDHRQRLRMGELPQGAQLIPNPYNKIAGFSCAGTQGGMVHFMPGFPVMAWPMIEWVLAQYYAGEFHRQPQRECAVIVYRAMEAALTPLMERIEAAHAGVKVFSLPSVDHPEHGPHIELGVKGPAASVPAAWADLLQGLHQYGANIGAKMVRDY